jgi:hypothetical protein
LKEKNSYVDFKICGWTANGRVGGPEKKSSKITFLSIKSLFCDGFCRGHIDSVEQVIGSCGDGVCGSCARIW